MLRMIMASWLWLPFVLGLPLAGVNAGEEGGPYFLQPDPGSALQGIVTVAGFSAIPGFQSAELSFAYLEDPTNTWFLITTSEQWVDEGVLGTWDTTTISDGEYTLRLRINLQDNTFLEAFLSGLRVRNYTPIETSTPAPTLVAASPTASPTMTSTPHPTPTSLPQNPAAISHSEVAGSMLFGASTVVLVVLVFRLLVRRRRK